MHARTHTPRFDPDQVLVAVDPGAQAEGLVALGCSMARAYDAVVNLMSVVRPTPIAWVPHVGATIPSTQRHRLARVESSRKLRHYQHQVAPSDLEVSISTPFEADPANAICALAAEQDVDVVVLGHSDGSWLEHLVFGSACRRIVRHAPCSALVVPSDGPRDAHEIDRILVGTDLSDASEFALHAAATLARRMDATLVVAHVDREHPVNVFKTDAHAAQNSLEARRIAAVLERQVTAVLGDSCPVPRIAVQLLRSHDPVTVLTTMAADEPNTLLVVGSHERTGWERLLYGSIAESVVGDATTPVLVARAPQPRAASISSSPTGLVRQASKPAVAVASMVA